ncbi:PglD-related sugar-binding protein [Paenibacillus sp. HW567]|uniref:PglD-related sugar-binding protein n=1 Tax=Paenibacillus sp. HW567 TaxID=1034769 RepID=UPI0003759408|nr:hypothetical protein [Paenibacillus sp. HW567]
MTNILVYGSGVLGQIVKQMVAQSGNTFAGFIDDHNACAERAGAFQDVLAGYPSDLYEIVIAIGYTKLQARWEVYQKVLRHGYRVPKLIHPQAMITDEALIGDGAILMMGSIVDVQSRIGELAVLWPGAVVNHDSEVGGNTFVGPNSTICGLVRIGSHSFIGAGSVIVNNNAVPERSFVKAGTVFYTQESLNDLHEEAISIRAGMKPS